MTVPVLRSQVPPNYGKLLEKSWIFRPSFDVMAEVAGVYILEMSNIILIKFCT